MDCPRARPWPRGQSINLHVPESKVSIAFSTLNSCSVTMWWISKFEWQLVALTCMWKLTVIHIFYWLMIYNSVLFMQFFAASIITYIDQYMDRYNACLCYYRRTETCTWCVSNQWKSVLHLWYGYFMMSENIISFLFCTMLYLSYVNLTIQLSQFDEYLA